MKLIWLTPILVLLGLGSLVGCANQNPCLTPQIESVEMEEGILIKDEGLKDLLRYIICLENK